VLRSLYVSVDFRPLFLFADVVFPWFVYADITSETVAIDTPNNVAVLFTYAPAKRAPTIFPLSKLDKSPDCHSTQSLQSVNKWKKNIQCWQLKFFQCSQHKFYVFFNFLVFPSFCSHLVYIVLHLKTLPVVQTLGPQCRMIRWQWTGRDVEGTGSGPILRQYRGICLETLRISWKFCHDSRRPDRDSSHISPETLSLKPCRSVRHLVRRFHRQ
jgi:hypothetical protein